MVEEDVQLASKMQSIEVETGLSISSIKDINRRMSIGEAKARRAERNGWSKPASGYFYRQKIHQPWIPILGLDSGN